MLKKRFGRVFLALAAFGTLPLPALADEIVHFTNGAEMTVRSHTVEDAKAMVKLDLGGNSFISFPMSMVDKIVNAGRDVFLNPSFQPSNQAIAGVAGGAVADNSIRGTGDPASPTRRPVGKGPAGAMLGEAADVLPVAAIGGQPIELPVSASRRIFNPAFPTSPGSAPQVIMPPGKFRAPVQISITPTRPPDTPVAPPPPVSTETEITPQDGDPAPENPPDEP